MANILYAGIETASKFTTLFNLHRGEFNKTHNSKNTAFIKVCIHPEEIETFEKLSQL